MNQENGKTGKMVEKLKKDAVLPYSQIMSKKKKKTTCLQFKNCSNL